MKYCTKCGNELLDDAVVCVKCGCPVQPTSPIHVAPAPEQLERKKKNRINTAFILHIIATASIILFVIAALTMMPDEYASEADFTVTVTFESAKNYVMLALFTVAFLSLSVLGCLIKFIKNHKVQKNLAIAYLILVIAEELSFFILASWVFLFIFCGGAVILAPFVLHLLAAIKYFQGVRSDAV